MFYAVVALNIFNKTNSHKISLKIKQSELPWKGLTS